MADPALRAVMAALDPQGGAARFVGGAVRNALIGAPVTDIDIATPLTPDEVMGRLSGARPGRGADRHRTRHGNGHSRGKPFEVTTLRRDVQPTDVAPWSPLPPTGAKTRSGATSP